MLRRARNLLHVLGVLPVNHGRGAIKLYPPPLALLMYATNSDK